MGGDSLYSIRSRTITIFSIWLTAALTIVVIPEAGADTQTHNIDLSPGAPFWFSLKDFDSEGDILTMTVLFLKKSDGSFQERPIDIMIIRSSRVRGTPTVEALVDFAMYYEQDVNRSIRDKEYEHDEGGKMSLLFFNDRLPGDDFIDDQNKTVKLRVDYEVTNVAKDEGANLVLIIIIMVIIIALIGLGILGFLFLKKKLKERSTFFNTDASGYYVFRDIDESIYYFTPQQYAKMYASNSLVTYEYLGQAAKKGGPILNPNVQQADMQVYDAQPMTPVPLEAQPQPMDQGTAPIDNMYPEGYDQISDQTMDHTGTGEAERDPPQQEEIAVSEPVQEQQVSEVSGPVQQEPMPAPAEIPLEDQVDESQVPVTVQEQNADGPEE